MYNFILRRTDEDTTEAYLQFNKDGVVFNAEPVEFKPVEEGEVASPWLSSTPDDVGALINQITQVVAQLSTPYVYLKSSFGSRIVNIDRVGGEEVIIEKRLFRKPKYFVRAYSLPRDLLLQYESKEAADAVLHDIVSIKNARKDITHG